MDMHHPLNLTLDLYLKRKAEAGEFDHLEGEGKPLDLDPGRPGIIEKLLQEADVKPLVVMLHQKSTLLQGHLKDERDPDCRRRIQHQLADVQTRIGIEIETWRSLR
ncbi:hypothetical protein R3X27_19220 [Tropicimonas sp. TH_r6]|uniref:hypothetical protein n=1 Tax=Tropicimonas sp. TH_r6 TaxID=3082085 RepID=UPI002955DBF9|nr:hypothetical protein [Tropicimonas sp. TH_r6]MDV7144817.1 hypothetical protein [Tropicimonas sp. TH_r6]